MHSGGPEDGSHLHANFHQFAAYAWASPRQASQKFHMAITISVYRSFSEPREIRISLAINLTGICIIHSHIHSVVVFHFEIFSSIDAAGVHCVAHEFSVNSPIK